MMDKLTARVSTPGYKAFGLFALRLALGSIFLMAGIGKLQNLEMTTQMFEGMGIPLAGIVAPLVGLVETFGGLALILGISTLASSFLLAIIMVVSILAVKLGGPFKGMQLDLALLGGLLALMGTGPGKWTIGKK
jgi:putative oxidoreductase